MISLIVRGIFSINWVKLYSCLSDQINLLIKKDEDDIGIRMRTFISQSKYFQRLILSLIGKIPILFNFRGEAPCIGSNNDTTEHDE